MTVTAAETVTTTRVSVLTVNVRHQNVPVDAVSVSYADNVTVVSPDPEDVTESYAVNAETVRTATDHVHAYKTIMLQRLLSYITVTVVTMAT